MCAALPHSSSSIQTILLVPEFHRVSGHIAVAGRGLYRQWGITPRPEDKVFSCFLWAVYDTPAKNATPNLKKQHFQEKFRKQLYK